jgi:hypothetical protein
VSIPSRRSFAPRGPIGSSERNSPFACTEWGKSWSRGRQARLSTERKSWMPRGPSYRMSNARYAKRMARVPKTTTEELMK